MTGVLTCALPISGAARDPSSQGSGDAVGSTPCRRHSNTRSRATAVAPAGAITEADREVVMSRPNEMKERVPRRGERMRLRSEGRRTTVTLGRIAGLSRAPPPADRLHEYAAPYWVFSQSRSPSVHVWPGGEPSRTSSMLRGASGGRSRALAGGSAMGEGWLASVTFPIRSERGHQHPAACDPCQQVRKDVRKDLTSRWTTKR